MPRLHRMEFWPYLSGSSPAEVEIKSENSLVYLEQNLEFLDFIPLLLKGVTDDIIADVERIWSQGLQQNPRLSNNPLPNIRRISDDGRAVDANFATYKSSFWIKQKLSELPFEMQETLARQFPFFNVGVVTVTSDGYVLAEQRPEGFTAPLMLLTYPCGYVRRGHNTLADAVNNQSKGELGFEVLDGSGQPYPYVKSVRSIGMQRESDEWTPNYTFLMELNIPANEIKPTRETKVVLPLPSSPRQLIELIAGFYSPTIKGDARGRLVPNATGMLALSFLAIDGNRSYQNLVDRLSGIAQKLGYKLEVREYTPQTNPFR